VGEICKNICQCNDCNIEEDECELAKAYLKQVPMKIQSDSCCKNVCPSCGGAVHKVLEAEVYCQYCGQLIDFDRGK
jgi:hypothetical protein